VVEVQFSFQVLEDAVVPTGRQPRAGLASSRICRYEKMEAGMRPHPFRLPAGPLGVAFAVLAIAAVWSHAARAGMITVVADVSAQNNFSFFDAVLGNQSSVVFSRGAVQQPTL
jgi:hypothetical protein